MLHGSKNFGGILAALRIELSPSGIEPLIDSEWRNSQNPRNFFGGVVIVDKPQTRFLTFSQLGSLTIPHLKNCCWAARPTDTKLHTITSPDNL